MLPVCGHWYRYRQRKSAQSGGNTIHSPSADIVFWIAQQLYDSAENVETLPTTPQIDKPAFIPLGGVCIGCAFVHDKKPLPHWGRGWGEGWKNRAATKPDNHAAWRSIAIRCLGERQVLSCTKVHDKKTAIVEEELGWGQQTTCEATKPIPQIHQLPRLTQTKPKSSAKNPFPCLRGKVACSAGRGDKTSKILSHTKGIDMSNATLPACAPLPLGAKNPQ